MPKVAKIKLVDRKDFRGGGYARRKFTIQEAKKIRREYRRRGEKGERVCVSALAKEHKVSQPLMYQLLNGKTYND